MSKFTIGDLTTFMRKAAGEDESVNLDGNIANVAFSDLGYDSLALLETASLVEAAYSVTIEEDKLVGLETPEEFVELVNVQLVNAR
ncbi:acyl carrier protein [Nocardia nova]|uniref:acyl carrier protein n=1 Tax=Nocardia nova TaxID=37330 RepID=UPI0033ED9514